MAVKPKSRAILEPIAESAIDTDNSPIKSLALSSQPEGETLIYIGTLSGVLLLYSLRISENAPPEIAFITRLSLPGGGSLNSVLPLVHIGKVIVLAGGFLYLLDPALLGPAKKISLFKGVTAFSRNFRTQRYNPTLYTNGGSQTNYVYSNGKNIDSSNLFAIGIGKKLVIAELILSGSLVILKEIQGVLDGIILTLLWVDDFIFVGTKIGYFLYNCVNGRCELIFLLPDSSGVPKMKLLVKECRVLLMVDNVGIIVDTEGQPVGGSLVFKEAPDSFREIGSYVVAANNLMVELYHKKMGCCSQRFMVGDGGVGPCVLADEENESGKLVIVATSLKLICYGKVSGEAQIKDLLRKKSFKEAVYLFEELQNEGEMTKEMLSFIHAQLGYLLLFELHFKEAVDHFLLAENMQPSELFPFIMRDPNRWTLLVPRNRYWGLHPPPKPLESVIDDGLTAIQKAVFLKKVGLETAVDDGFLLNPPSRADLLESAIKNMIRYLEACRERDLAISVREGVDTLLMYLYRSLNCVDDMERLASSENSCVVEELEALLNESGHLRTLAFLYAGKGMSAKAVSTWRILARNYSANSHIKVPPEETDSSRKRTLGWETAAMEATKILEESPDQDLVLQHLGWVRFQILCIYRGYQPDEVIAAIDPKKVEILQRYLQWLIEDQDSDDSQFHTAYALLLAKSAIETYQVELSSQASLPENEKNVSEVGTSLIFDSPVRDRLQIFLQSSELYDAEEVLDMIEDSELWLEKAILYRRLGQEALVLNILALKLENYEAAEQYCVEIGRPDAYMQLLEIYLDPKDGREPMFKAAVRLLHNHGEMLDPLQVLERLSADMPLQLASDTILKLLRARHHHHLQGKIVRNLSHALEVDASLARQEERSRNVQINDESTCDSCHARLGTKLFAMYPDDSVVCYKCYRRQGESTSISGRDFRKDVILKPGWLVTR
ncbi:transforming growth factor-beta receptor-associated protein 1 [Phtheirospermum japonicum]|uniref:Transforming growth factor-beta receptor-associated protein 1 n=1 Tax=Phtheirospermum japonicum TaxID=374723 RepID=A0A830D7G7_9LAMI|nr:transforming growth factor-beta receptor-associated protein 1 [Phtheirospermum japonicum]